MQLAHTCTYPKKIEQVKATRSYYDSPFPFLIISSSYKRKIISTDLCTCCLRRKDHQLPALPSDLQLKLGSLGMWQSRESPLQSPSSPCCFLCTQVCGQSCTPLGAQQGKGETSNPANAPTAPLSLLSAAWEQKAQQGTPETQAERLRGDGLLHCREGQKQNHKEALVPKDKSTDQGCFSEQQRASNILLFHQLYSPLNNTEEREMALQEVENHPFVLKAGLTFPY